MGGKKSKQWHADLADEARMKTNQTIDAFFETHSCLIIFIRV